MLPKIIEMLKTAGPITNVIRYGTVPIPQPPYVVVRPELDIANRGRGFRITAHFSPGQDLDLSDYVTNSIPDILDGKIITGRHGERNEVELLQPDSDIIVSNDDGTISMERLILLPSPEYIRR